MIITTYNNLRVHQSQSKETHQRKLCVSIRELLSSVQLWSETTECGYHIRRHCHLSKFKNASVITYFTRSDFANYFFGFIYFKETSIKLQSIQRRIFPHLSPKWHEEIYLMTGTYHRYYLPSYELLNFSLHKLNNGK